MSAPYPDPFEVYIINAINDAGWIACLHCEALSPADAMGVRIDNHTCDELGAVSITFNEFVADRLELDNWGSM